MKKLACLALALSSLTASAQALKPLNWDGATIYFLLTDRFNNANPSNDLAYGRQRDAAPLRGYMGGDLAGVTAKIKEGYFNDLGIDAIWITPPVEQIHGGTDEGTGKSYGFHGYWARDFTAVDANLGTEQDVRELVDTAHAHGIRVLLDVVMNQTGPVTAQDPVWPADWVRTGPPCTYRDAKTTMTCTLVKNLPDFRTESDTPVALPAFLAEKWKREGRYEREVKELDEFFARTGYPRAPRYYLMKWHSDWVRKFGFDGFRCDTVKHVEPGVWKDLKQVASAAYEDWKKGHPGVVPPAQRFWMTAEVYNFSVRDRDRFDLGGLVVNYYDQGFDSMINFTMKSDARAGYDDLFTAYAGLQFGGARRYPVLNYMSSHDDGEPFDQLRTKPFETANKLLLAPGAAQVTYGDETARLLKAPGAEGDATLRSFMNWDELARNTARNGYGVAEVRRHWALLGRFRHDHPSIGAGAHRKLADQPYTFARSDGADKVVVALDVPAGPAALKVAGVFADGQHVTDHYSGSGAIVANGLVVLPDHGSVILLAAD
ncbi:MAG: alpha-amylase family glycosyl hydrolase [Telluria sp.]